MGMKEIILVRHGKSSWEYGVEDRDRPLMERGIADALLLAGALRQLPRPDAVFSSPANRALHTCTILMREIPLPLEVLRLTDALYDFSGGSVASFVKGLDNSLNRVMLFGHNHAFTHLANAWGNQYIDNVPTTGCVHLRLEAKHWSQADKGQTLQALFPKHLK